MNFVSGEECPRLVAHGDRRVLVEVNPKLLKQGLTKFFGAELRKWYFSGNGRIGPHRNPGVPSLQDEYRQQIGLRHLISLIDQKLAEIYTMLDRFAQNRAGYLGKCTPRGEIFIRRNNGKTALTSYFDAQNRRLLDVRDAWLSDCFYG